MVSVKGYEIIFVLTCSDKYDIADSQPLPTSLPTVSLFGVCFFIGFKGEDLIDCDCSKFVALNSPLRNCFNWSTTFIQCSDFSLN